MFNIDEQSYYCIFVAAPLRLMVMKNGVRDITKSVAVVGPDLTNVRNFYLKLTSPIFVESLVRNKEQRKTYHVKCCR